jgi:integrase
LYERVLNRRYSKIDFSRPREEHKLPRVLDSDVILKAIDNIRNIKHRCILSIAFSVGLRVSEVLNLRIKEIDSKRMVMWIRQSKGKKDRMVPLSDTVLSMLRDYYKQYRPKEFLFEGQNGGVYSAGSCNKLVKRYIGEDYHFHMLRHSCFTYLLEQGVDIRIIQELAGHSSCKTTEVYTHISKRTLNKLPLAI